MKTLYININGEDIQSSDDIIVVGRPEDAIINKFFFELGKEILKGVVAPGISSIKKKDIVTDFKVHDEKSFNIIVEQWDSLKQKLLGENPSGLHAVKLPDEYISWLQNSSQPAYAEIAESLYKRGGSVEVSLDKIYKNAIGIIINNIKPEECKDCGQFVVNDDAVTDDSVITESIQDGMPPIVFVPFEDFGKCPNCWKKPCECKSEKPVCLKCGKDPCECEVEPSNARFIFAVQFKDDIIRLYDSNGKLSCRTSFLPVESGDLDYLNTYYERNICSEEKKIYPPKKSPSLYVKKINDNTLCKITNKEIIPVCYYGDENIFYRNDNIFSVVTERRGSAIYEDMNDSVKLLFKTRLRIDNYHIGEKFIIDVEDDVVDSVYINVETYKKVIFKGYEAYYIGLLNGNDYFIASREDQESKFPILNTSKKVVDYVDVNKDIMYEAMIVDETTIKFGSHGYYLLDCHIFCKDIFGNLYFVEDDNDDLKSIYVRKSKKCIFNNLNWIEKIGNEFIAIQELGKDITFFLDKNGKEVYACEIGESILSEPSFSDSLLALYDDEDGAVWSQEGILRRVINDRFEDVESWPRGYRDLRSTQGLFYYGKLVVIDDYEQSVGYIDSSGQEYDVPFSFEETIMDAYMLFNDVIYVEDEYKNQYLLTTDGREIIPHSSYSNIKKLSEDYFSAWYIQGGSYVVFDSKGKKINFELCDTERNLIKSVAVI